MQIDKIYIPIQAIEDIYINTDSNKAAPALYAMSVYGAYMETAGIYNGDYVLADASIKPSAFDNICICDINGKKTIAQYIGKAGASNAVITRGRSKAQQIYTVSDIDIYGVVVACVAPDGAIRWTHGDRRV